MRPKRKINHVIKTGRGRGPRLGVWGSEEAAEVLAEAGERPGKGTRPLGPRRRGCGQVENRSLWIPPCPAGQRGPGPLPGRSPSAQGPFSDSPIFMRFWVRAAPQPKGATALPRKKVCLGAQVAPRYLLPLGLRGWREVAPWIQALTYWP